MVRFFPSVRTSRIAIDDWLSMAVEQSTNSAACMPLTWSEDIRSEPWLRGWKIQSAYILRVYTRVFATFPPSRRFGAVDAEVIQCWNSTPAYYPQYAVMLTNKCRQIEINWQPENRIYAMLFIRMDCGEWGGGVASRRVAHTKHAHANATYISGYNCCCRLHHVNK